MSTKQKHQLTLKTKAYLSLALAFLLTFSPILPSLNPPKLFGYPASEASSVVWNGDGNDSNWTTPENWSSNTVPGPNDIVTFNGSNSRDVTINDDLSVEGIEIEADYDAAITINSNKRLTVGIHGFHQRGGTFKAGGAPMDIVGSMTLIAGSFTAPSSFLNIKGNLTILTNKFNHNNGTVILNGIEQVVFGSANFYNFTKEALVPQTLEFQSGQTLSTEGDLILKGSKFGALKLRASQPDVPFVLNPQDIADASYLDVKDSINTRLDPIDCLIDCTDSGNVNGWNIIEASEEKTDTADATTDDLLELDDTDPLFNKIINDIKTRTDNLTVGLNRNIATVKDKAKALFTKSEQPDEIITQSLEVSSQSLEASAVIASIPPHHLQRIQ